MRSLVVLIAVAALAVAAAVPAARGATACASKKSGTVAYSKIRVTSTTCATALKTAKAWAKGLKSGTSSQRKCAPQSVKGTASCKVGAFSCKVKATPTAVAPAELATCTYGKRKVSWRADFD
jgi:hypothetical protein